MENTAKFGGERTLIEGAFSTTPKTPHGVLPIITPQGQVIYVYGGPWANRPRGMLSVKVAEEQKPDGDLNLDIKDFSVPAMSELTEVIDELCSMLDSGIDEVFVGCAGGSGRTGLFMACLLITYGVTEPEDAINMVRKVYKRTAIETAEQEVFIVTYACLLDAEWDDAPPTMWERFKVWWSENWA